MSEVQEKAGVIAPYVIKNPTVIRVLTIKAKYLEQMPRLEKNIPKVEVIGTTHGGAWVILRQVDNGHLVRVHSVDWISYLIDDSPETDYKVSQRKAGQQIEAYPQVFED